MILDKDKSNSSRINIIIEENDFIPNSKVFELEKYGKRLFYKYICKECNKIFYGRKEYSGNYCSDKCKWINIREELRCETCGKIFLRKKSSRSNSVTGHYFCSRKCKDLAQRIDGGLSDMQPSYYTDGSGNYRQKALRELDNICSVCNYDENVKMLDVHHKDGDRTNNSLKNLEILCVWCHALKTREVMD